MAEGKLTLKQQLWVEAYLGRAKGNGTEAARLAGYRGNDATLCAIGKENLRKPPIAEKVSRRVAEAAMEADEVLSRLAEHARGSIEDFIEIVDGGYRLDLAKARRLGRLRLIHSIAETQWGPKIELYDAQSALVQIGRHHKLFTDNVELGAKQSLLDVIREAKRRRDENGKR